MKSKLSQIVSPEVGVEPDMLDLIGVHADEGPYVSYDGENQDIGDFYYGLLEDLPEVIFSLTPGGNISYLNHAFRKLTGWTREQWIGRNFSELIDVDMRKDTMRELLQFENSHRKKVLETKMRVNGGSINAEISAAFRLRHGADMSIIGTLGDNTDKKRSDEAHALQEKRIRALYEISAEPGVGIETQLTETLKTGAGLLSMEVAGVGHLTGRNCTVLYCYDEMGRVTQGLECELSKTFCKITIANDDVVAMDHVGESEYRDEEFYEGFGFESYIGVPLRIDGAVFGTLNFASPYPRNEPFTNADKDFIRLMGRWIGTMIERKKAEDLLREKEELYRTLVENAHDLILEINYDGRLMYVSSNHKEIMGYDPQELLGRNVFEFVHPEDRTALLSEFINGLKTKSTAKVVHRYRHKNGDWRWFESTGKPFRTSAGEIRAIIDTREITERKKNEEQIQKSLIEKESLLREIHHRVKNNLQVISSLLSLQSDYAKDEESLSLFYDSQNRIATIALIHEKLYQSRNLAEIKMLDYITDMTRNLLKMYDRVGSSMDVQINAYDISVNIDIAIPCGLIINELFTNCIKHAFVNKNGGEGTPGPKAKITVELYSESDANLVLSVRDNGVGFPRKIDFRDTSTLGLQLVCALTEQLNGTIELVRRNGTGFYIVFPVSGRPNAAPRTQPGAV